MQLFQQHAHEWAMSLNASGEPLDVAISRGKAEILADVRAGRVPASVLSFSELHDYADANGYGNAFDWPVLPSEMEDGYQKAHLAFWNQVQNTLNDWIASGQMRKEFAELGARRK